MIDAALTYAARGWAVFPVWENKAPATPNGFKDATSDPDAVRELWQQHPGPGIGIATGSVSAIFVLDIDPAAGGDETFHELVGEHGDLPASVEALTGGGGRHVYLQHPGWEVRCSAGQLGPGLDIRGDGGYVVTPPSPHVSGRAYEWEVSHHPDETQVAPAPDWLLALLRPTARATHGADARASSGDLIPAGRRNSTLASLAGSMRRRGMTESEILAALQSTNRGRCRPPLTDVEVGRIAASISRYEPGAADASTDHGNAPAFEVMTARDLCLLADPPSSNLLLGPVLVRGARTVLGAHTGEGKTTLALQMVAAVVHERDWLGHTGAGGRVLVIDAEQGLRTIKRRLREAGLDQAVGVDYLRVPDGLSLDEDGPDTLRLEALLAAGDYALVVADPLYKLHHGDSNEERHAVDLMRRFDRWREQHQFALLMLVHLRKPPPQGARFSIHEFFGSGGYLRGAEVALGIRRMTPGYSRLHFFKDRDGDLPVGESWGLIFDRATGFRRDPDDGKERETSVAKVQRTLEDQPGCTLEKLARATGFTERTVRDALKKLNASYASGPHNARLWRLPDTDLDAADQ